MCSRRDSNEDLDYDTPKVSSENLAAIQKSKENPMEDKREKFAVKIIRARDEEYQHVALKEFHLLRSLNHHGIIKMVDAFVNRSRHTIYLVMDLVEG
jgi:serine/threonine protein kinase